MTLCRKGYYMLTATETCRGANVPTSLISIMCFVPVSQADRLIELLKSVWAHILALCCHLLAECRKFLFPFI